MVGSQWRSSKEASEHDIDLLLASYLLRGSQLRKRIHRYQSRRATLLRCMKGLNNSDGVHGRTHMLHYTRAVVNLQCTDI